MPTVTIDAHIDAPAVLGWPYARHPMPSLLGLMAGLVGSGGIFVYLVLIRPDPDTLGGPTEAEEPDGL